LVDKADVPVVLFDPDVNGMSSSSNADIPTLAGYVVYARCFQTKVILNRLKETGSFPRWEVYSFDIMF
jgi:hypothetical protein